MNSRPYDQYANYYNNGGQRRRDGEYSEYDEGRQNFRDRSINRFDDKSMGPPIDRFDENHQRKSGNMRPMLNDALMMRQGSCDNNLPMMNQRNRVRIDSMGNENSSRMNQVPVDNFKFDANIHNDSPGPRGGGNGMGPAENYERNKFMQVERGPHQQNFDSTGPPNISQDVVSSLQSFSHIGAQQQNDIAAKILTAVLSTVPNLTQLGQVNTVPSGNLNFQGSPSGISNFQGGSGSNVTNFQGGHDRNQNFESDPGRNTNFHIGRGRGSHFHGRSQGHFNFANRNESRENRNSQNQNYRNDSTSYPSQSWKFSPGHDKFSMNKQNSRPLSRFDGRLEQKIVTKDHLQYKRSQSIETPKLEFRGKRRNLSGERTENPQKRERKSPKEQEAESTNDQKNVEMSVPVDGKKIDSGNKTSPQAELPAEALLCHICNQSKFTSEKTYLFHLEGLRHKNTAKIFREKNDATLTYLRENAKLATTRYGGYNPSFPPKNCNICHALVKEDFRKHKKNLEHCLVDKFLNPMCCDRKFKSKYDVDEHRLSLPHLRRIFENKESIITGVQDLNNTTDFNDLINFLKSGHNAETTEHTTANDLPPFDGDTMMGISLLKEKNSAFCLACKTFLMRDKRTLKVHLESLSHYTCLTDYLTKQENNKAWNKSKVENSDKTAAEGSPNTKIMRERAEYGSDADDSDEEAMLREIHGDDEDLPGITENDIIIEEVGEDYESKVDDNNRDETDESAQVTNVHDDEDCTLIYDDDEEDDLAVRLAVDEVDYEDV